MSRSVRPALIAALLMALVVSGCGIPDDTAVVPVGVGPSKGTSTGDDTSADQKSLRTDTTDKTAFLANFLTAAAGDYDSATDEVKKFMSPEAAGGFKPLSPDIKVVHLLEKPLINPDEPTASIRYRQVGTLSHDGVLTPPKVAGEPKIDNITIGTIDGQSGLFVIKAPQVLMISDTALSTFYDKRTIYFWNTDRTWLVPDVRYMPTSVPKEQQPTAVLTWLINGPAEWLQSVAQPLRTGTKMVGVVPAVTDDTLQINLSGALPPDTAKDPDALDRLQKQLRWSLRANLPAALELNVDHSADGQIYRGEDFLDSNALYRRPAEPERFAVFDGQIRRLGSSRNASQGVPVVLPAANRNVRMAAFGGASTSWDYAALVVKNTSGHLELRVGSAAPGKQVALRKVGVREPVGRPVWAASPPVGTTDSTVGLIPANGKLYSFPPDGTTIRPVAGVDDVSAVAVAPDAGRLALISRGRLYMATLSNADGLQLSTLIPISTQMVGLTAVDWRDEATLVVSGRKPDDDNRVAVMDVSIDGASQTPRLTELGSNTLTYLTAYPARPSQSAGTSVPVAYELSGSGYDESSAQKIGLSDLAQPVTNPRAGAQVTAPFFLN